LNTDRIRSMIVMGGCSSPVGGVSDS